MNYLLLFLLFLMAGCFSSNEADPELVKLFGPYCESLGHEKGSPEYIDCIEKIGRKK